MEPLNPIELAYRRLCQKGQPPIKLFSGLPNEQGFQFPKEILNRGYESYFNRMDYLPEPKGLKIARESIAHYYQGQGASVDIENILLTSGTSESFLYLFTLLGKTGDNVLVPNPAYPLFEEIAKIAQLELKQYPLLENQHWEIDLELLEGLIDERTKAILIISPNNPTGAVHDRKTLESLVHLANLRGLPLICDEVFAEFYFGEKPFPRVMAVTQPDLCFTLNGISKMFALPALKLAWIAVTGSTTKINRVMDRLEMICDTFLSCHIPIQETLPQLFSEGKEFMHAYRSEIQSRRNLALAQLKAVPGITVNPPQGGFYLMGRVDQPGGLSEEEWIIQLMEKKGVFVHPGYFFDYERGVHFVLSYLTKPDLLSRGIQAIADFTNGP